MGTFYGNITNTSRTSFQFDKTFPNRFLMDAGIKTDGILPGRQVLIEYDYDPTIGMTRVVFDGNKAYYWQAEDSNQFNPSNLITKRDITKGTYVYEYKTDESSSEEVSSLKSIFYIFTSNYD